MFNLPGGLDMKKLKEIHDAYEQYESAAKKLANLSEVTEKKSLRKINPYSITELVYNILKDSRRRKVSDIVKEIKNTTGFDVEAASVRSAAKYMVKQGKLYMTAEKEFGLHEKQQEKEIVQHQDAREFERQTQPT